MRYIVTFLLVFLFSFSIRAQEEGNKVWTLEDCIHYAKENNIQLQQAGLQVSSAEINYRQSKDNCLPNLNAGANYGLNFGTAIDPTTNAFSTKASQAGSVSLNSNMSLYNGGSIKKTIKQRGLEYDLAKLEVQNMENNLILAILSSYLQILTAEEQLNVLDKQSALTYEQLEQTQKLIKAGMRPKGDVLDIEAQVANEEVTKVNAENIVAAAYMALAQSMDYYGSIRIQKPEIDIPSLANIDALEPTQIYEAAVNTQPEIKTANLRTQIAEQSLRVVESGKHPSLGVGANLNTRFSSLAKRIDEDAPLTYKPISYYTPNGELVETEFYQPNIAFENTPLPSQFADNFGGYIGLNLNVPLFNQNRIKNNIALSKINIDNSRLQEQAVKNNLRRTIEQAYLDAKAAAQKYKATQSSMEALQKAFEFAEKKYNAGTANTFEYFTAKNNLAIAELNLQSAKYEYFFRMKILDYYQGKPIQMQ